MHFSQGLLIIQNPSASLHNVNFVPSVRVENIKSRSVNRDIYGVLYAADEHRVTLVNKRYANKTYQQVHINEQPVQVHLVV